MDATLHFLGISGSLRQHSYNTATLRAASTMLPLDTHMDIFDLTPIPMYDEDVRMRGFPPAVQAFRERIAASDALLIVSPEYNYSIPGPLKNAIDWASRPPAQPFDGKPIAIMGASPSGLGTARCQYQLRQVFIYLNGMVLNQPEVMIAHAPGKFDEQDNLVDEATREHVRNLLAGLAAWTRRLQRS